MLGIPRRHSHFIFAVIQAGLTCLIAAGIASLPMLNMGQFLAHWLLSWIIAWVTMLPVVLLAAPLIRAVSVALTREERAN
jgi:integral membrane sensor domain MASE1